MSVTVRLLGLDFADLDAPHAAELLARRPAGEPFGYVATPNADHLVRLHRRPELAPLYEGAMVRLLDSRVVALASRFVGLPTPRVAPGSDLTAALLRNHVSRGERVTVIGLSARWLPALMQRTRSQLWHITIRRRASISIQLKCVRRSTSCWHIRQGSCSWRSVPRVRKCWPRRSAPRDARPALGFALAPAWSSSPAGGRVHHNGCSMLGWNGCIACYGNPGEWHSAT